MAKKKKQRGVLRKHRVDSKNATPSRWTLRRHRIAQEAAQDCRCPQRGLPMPHANGDTKVELVERFHYQEHRRRHLKAFPDYDAGWDRPLPETAREVYDLVKSFAPALTRSTATN